MGVLVRRGGPKRIGGSVEIRRFTVVYAVLLVLLPNADAQAHKGCHTGRCKARVAWRFYKQHPLPWCTWGPESGGKYRARNPQSTAGGKYQILDSTWYANGGKRYRSRWPAAVAPPLEQERVAHRLFARSGGSPWVNC